METFIKASGLRIWDVIEHGNNVPLDDEGLAKPRSTIQHGNNVPLEHSRIEPQGHPLYSVCPEPEGVS